MNQHNNMKFKKSISKDSNNPQIRRDKIKNRIMEKYHVSYDEAEKILILLEKKEIKNSKNQNRDTIPKSNNSLQDINFKKEKTYNNFNEVHKNYDNFKESIINEHSDRHGKSTQENFNKNTKRQNIDDLINEELMEVSSSKTVDSILEDIIPEYNQQISIKVDHVDLTFEVANEKIDTIKETFIRTLKRTKSNTIKIHALKDVSFQIYKGEKVGIIGYNGAGKSTLLNVITGIFPPDKGNVITYGKISPLLALGSGFDYNFSGRKNIILNGAVLGYDKDFLESKMDEIIDFSELREFIDIPIKNYSSGMLAKLGFSIATMVNPDILIIDEILGVGDVNFQKKSADKIRSLMDGGTTVLLVSHSIPQIRELCDKAIWIDNGYVRAVGEVNKICDEYLKDAEKASNEQLANIDLISK